MNTRTESDSIGTLQVPADAYYGVQSLRARQNHTCRLSGRTENPALVPEADAAGLPTLPTEPQTRPAPICGEGRAPI